MARTRKKILVRNLLSQECCGIPAGGEAFLEPWLADHMVDVIKSGERVQPPKAKPSKPPEPSDDGA